jgi:hypothetical protein
MANEKEETGNLMKYLVNGTLRPEKTRADFLATMHHEPLSDEAWELVRKGVITEHGFKIGQRPGFFLIMEGTSAEAVQAALAKIPILQEGWCDIEVDPISPFISDIR